MTNIKKIGLIIISAGFAGLSTLAHAAMYVPPPATEKESLKKNGLYAGIEIGGIGFQQEANYTLSSVNSDGDLSANKYGFDNTGGVGFNSTLLVGYDWYLPKRMFLGVEAFGNLTNTSSSSGETQNQDDTGNSYSSSSTLQSVYGIRALPGYQATEDTVLYGIVGYARSHVQNHSNPGYVIVNSSEITFPENTSSSDLNGYQLGLGSMINITEHIAIRGDIIYTGYENNDYGPETRVDSTGTTKTSSNQYSQYTVEGDVGIVYKFD